MNPTHLSAGISATESTSQALAIPEILELIIKLLETRNLASCARVCREWSGIALALLWRDLPNIILLLKVLLPLELANEAGSWVFTGSATDPDWKRFQMYANLVRCTRQGYWGTKNPVYDVVRTSQGIHPEVWSIISETSTGPMLPNLTELWWDLGKDRSCFEDMLHLVTPTVKKLHIWVGFSSRLLHELDDHAKMLRNLAAIDGLKLDSLEYTSAHEHNETIKTCFSQFLATQLSLSSLSIELSISGGTIIATIPKLVHLRDLTITWQLNQSDDATVKESLQRLHGSCPNLSALKLRWGYRQQQAPASFDLRPLINCGWNLEELELTRGWGIELRPEDIRTIGTSYPNLKKLAIKYPDFLHRDPIPVGLDLSSLDLFAKSFPELRELDVVVDCQDTNVALSTRFRHLQKLYASEWIIREGQVEGAAKCLAKVCPMGREVLCGSGVEISRSGHPRIDKESEENRDRWILVAEAIGELNREN